MTNQPPLSEREQEILQLVATGLTNREIAQQLSISHNTVKVHLSNIFEKINAASRTEAVIYGIEHGLVEVPGGETASGQQPLTWRDVLRKYIWVWIPLLVVLAVFIVLIRTGVIFGPPEPEPETASDVAESWQELAALPESRIGMAAVAYNQDVFVIAGEGQEGVSGTVFHYSIAEGTWTRMSDKPTPVRDVEGVLIGEKVFVPGGFTAAGTPTDILEIFDPRQNLWKTGASLPIPISAYALVDFEGLLYLFGGWDGEQALDVVYVYDPASDSWQEGEPMPAASQDLGAVAFENRIIVMGGQYAGESLDQAWTYFPSRDVEGGNPWEAFISMPAGCYDFGVASVYDTIYVIGGMVEDNDAQPGGAWMMTGEDWVDLPVNQDYSERRVAVVPLGSKLFILDPEESLAQTKTWVYQAFYYSIYIPYMP
jgi:DNA-binding CsgD family transcriptional regulator